MWFYNKNYRFVLRPRNKLWLVAAFLFLLAIIGVYPTLKTARADTTCFGNIDPAASFKTFLQDQRLNTDVSVVKLVAKLAQMKTDSISYSDVFGGLATTGAISNCFKDGQYAQGLKIAAQYGENAAVNTVLQKAAGSSLITLPAEVVDLGTEILRAKLNNVAVDNIVSNYIVAMQQCTARGTSLDACTNQLVTCSNQAWVTKNSKPYFISTACSDEFGFLLNGCDGNAWLMTNTQNFTCPDFPPGSAVFYQGAKAIYEQENLGNSNSFSVAEHSLVQKYLDDFEKSGAETATVSENSNFWGSLLNTLSSAAQTIGQAVTQTVTNVIKIFTQTGEQKKDNLKTGANVLEGLRGAVNNLTSPSVVPADQSNPELQPKNPQPQPAAPAISSGLAALVTPLKNSVTAPAASQITQPQTTQNISPPPPTCAPNWTCGDWSACTNNKQARTCVDANNCGVTANVPVTQPCVSNPAAVSTPPPPPAPFSTLTSDYGGVEYGEGTTLHWSSSNATNCTASGGWNGNKPLSGSENTGPLYSTQTFNLTCTGPGGSVSQHVSISVSSPPQSTVPNPSAPTLTLSTKTGWVKSGTGTTLVWSSSNADTCTASGGWSGNKSLSGSEDTGPLNSTQTFVLTCTGPGGSATRSTSVGIADQPELSVADSYAATQGKTFNFSGKKFTPNGGVTIHFSKPDGSFYPVQHSTAGSSGGFAYAWPVPADAAPGSSAVSATDDISGMQSNSLGFNIVAAAQVSGDVEISVFPPSGPAGTAFTITGKNFTPNSSLILRFELPDTDQYSDRHYPPQQPAADANGNLSFNWQSPQDAPSFLLGTVSVWALDNRTGRRSNSVPVRITAGQ